MELFAAIAEHATASGHFRRKTSAGRAYLQIVESRRDGDQVRQQVIATLGRFDELQASGQLERLVRSGARFAAKAMVLSAASNNAAIKIAVRRIGPALVFERLWEETGCRPDCHAELPLQRLPKGEWQRLCGYRHRPEIRPTIERRSAFPQDSRRVG